MTPSTTNALRTIAFLLATTAAAQGAVSVQQVGGTLKLKGDTQSNAVAIDGTGALGEIAISINLGAPQPFIGVRNIAVEFGPAGDDLNLRCLQIGGSVRAKLGAGQDEFVISSSIAALNRPVLIGGSLDVNMGGQSLDFAVASASATAGITIGGNATFKGVAFVDFDGVGASSNSDATDIAIGGNLRIASKHTADLAGTGFTLELNNVNVGGTTKIKVGASADSVHVVKCHFARNVNVTFGAGNDLMFLEHSEFNTTIGVNGGGGSDTFDTLQMKFLSPPALTSVELVP